MKTIERLYREFLSETSSPVRTPKRWRVVIRGQPYGMHASWRDAMARRYAWVVMLLVERLPGGFPAVMAQRRRLPLALRLEIESFYARWYEIKTPVGGWPEGM